MIMESMSLGLQEQDKEDLSGYKNLYGEIDFKLLLNEHTYIEKEDKFALIGVENWGKISKGRILTKLRKGCIKRILKF
jgi:hypothetical protein